MLSGSDIQVIQEIVNNSTIEMREDLNCLERNIKRTIIEENEKVRLQLSEEIGELLSEHIAPILDDHEKDIKAIKSYVGMSDITVES